MYQQTVKTIHQKAQAMSIVINRIYDEIVF